MVANFSDDPRLNGFVARAQQERSEALARAGYLAIHAVEKAAGTVAALTSRSAAAVWQGLQRWHERQVTIRELSRLDDRLLQDIGLHRDGIEAVADALLDSRYDRPGKLEFGVPFEPPGSGVNDNEPPLQRRGRAGGRLA